MEIKAHRDGSATVFAGRDENIESMQVSSVMAALAEIVRSTDFDDQIVVINAKPASEAETIHLGNGRVSRFSVSGIKITDSDGELHKLKIEMQFGDRKFVGTLLPVIKPGPIKKK